MTQLRQLRQLSHVGVCLPMTSSLVAGGDLEDGVGEVLAVVRQELERVAKQVLPVELLEQLPDRATACVGLDCYERLSRSTLASVRRRDGVERRRALDGDAVGVCVHRPPEAIGLEDDERVIQIPANTSIKYLVSSII